MAILNAITVFLRRMTGSAGAPTTLLSGQPFMNEAENVLYVGTGDNGSKQSTAQIKIGGAGAFVDLASAQAVAGKKTFSVAPTVPNGAAANDAAAFGQIGAAVAPLAPKASPSFTGNPTTVTPAVNDNSGSIANTAWVTAALSALVQGLQPKPTATVATAAALPAYAYSNSAGTLTASANGALTVDGYSPAANDIVLVNLETGSNAAYNGLYTVTQVGSSTAPWILTRHIDMVVASEFSGALVPVGNAGATTANSLWLCNPAKNFTLGTTAVPFSQLNGATDLLQGAGISILGNTIAVLGWASVTAGALIKMTASGLAPAVAGTDYVAPFSAIDPGTA